MFVPPAQVIIYHSVKRNEGSLWRVLCVLCVCVRLERIGVGIGRAIAERTIGEKGN
jgi:hypothetical protein